MMRVVTRVFVVAAICVLGIAVASVQSFAEQEVTVWLWTAHSTEDRMAWNEKFTESYEMQNPGCTVRFAFTNFGPEPLIVATAAGSVPDVSLVSAAYGRDLYEAGVMRDLNDFVERTPHVSMDKFIPAAQIFNQKDGRVYGIPWSIEAEAILYNKTHVLEAGLDPSPNSLATWDALLTYARRLTQTDADGTITRSGYEPCHSMICFTSFLYSNGGEFYREDGRAVAFNSDKGVQAVEFMASIMHQNQVFRSGHTVIDGTTASMGHKHTSSTRRGFTEWLMMAPIPKGPQGDQPRGATWSNMWVIPRSAPNPELSWTFIEHWLRPEVQEAEFLHFGGLHPRAPLKDFFRQRAFVQASRTIPYMEAMSGIFLNAKPIAYIRQTDINKVLAPRLTDAVNRGTLVPKAALDEAARLANAILQPQ
ncbi:MAG: ABC transporter substrate-binding protein [Limnochordia bacterium]|jgi:multiple sugar transport system substrate-binding protein